MRRIEPTLGGIDELRGIGPTSRPPSVHARSSNSRSAWIASCVIVSILWLVVSYALFHTGSIGHFAGDGIRSIAPKAMVLAGIAIFWSICLLGTIALFCRGASKGVLSIVIPGYWFFALRSQGLGFPFVGFFYFGLLVYVTGAILVV